MLSEAVQPSAARSTARVPFSEAAAFGCDNTERILRLHHIQASQLGAGRGAAERSARAGGMKTFVVMAWRDGFGNLAFYFHTHVIRDHEIFPSAPSQLTHRKC